MTDTNSNTPPTATQDYNFPFPVGAVKLPSFWNDDPAMWFELCEAQFRLHNITRALT